MPNTFRSYGSTTPDGGDPTAAGFKRAGRVSLWAIFPPLGFWRSYRHGREQANIRQAKRIAEELKR